jgi:CBS domain-containing protein
MTLTCEPRIADPWASPLESVPHRTVVAVRAGASVRRVAKLMHTTGASSVLVRSTRPAIVTELDLVRAVAQGKSPGALVDDVASEDLVTATPSTTLRRALHLMLDHQIRHLVVVDADQEATGVVSMRDIVGGAADQTKNGEE